MISAASIGREIFIQFILLQAARASDWQEPVEFQEPIEFKMISVETSYPPSSRRRS
jgi:hypothetical protein